MQNGKSRGNAEGDLQFVAHSASHVGISFDIGHREEFSSDRLFVKPQGSKGLRILAVFGWTVVGGLVILGAMFLRRKREDWAGSDADSNSPSHTPSLTPITGMTPRLGISGITPITGMTPKHTPRTPGTTPREKTPRTQTPRGHEKATQGLTSIHSERLASLMESGISSTITRLPGHHKQPKMFKVFGREVIADDHAADYVLVLPLRGPGHSSTHVHVTGGRMQVINWDETVDGLALAQEIFQKSYMSRIVSLEELSQRFQAQMTRESYILTIRNLIVELFAGPHFGLKIKVLPSVDNDELMMKISLPKKNATISQFAANVAYKMALSDVAYERIGSSIPKDIFGTEMRAVAEFIPEHAEYFEPFSRVDRLVLLRARIDKYLDLDRLVSQGAIVGHFPLHNYTEVMAMCEGWANPWQWFRLPTDDAHHSVRNYFGEEVAWMFVWQSYFTRALLLPAALGACVWYCRFVLPVATQHKLQIVYAIFMGLWCAWFNAYYERQENRLRHSWGMNDFTPLNDLLNRYDYKPELDGSQRVQWAPVLGDLLSFLFVCLSVTGMTVIQSIRQSMVDSGAHWMWIQSSGVLISIQIIGLDRCWRRASLFVVSLENHRSDSKWLESWVRKLFPFRLFNNLYPFLYIGFIKQYMRGGCPKIQDGCVQELETDLITYFILRVIAEFGIDQIYLALVRAQMLAEMKKKEAEGKRYTYVEVQSKAFAYDKVMLMDDWTEQVLTFAFVACFNVILPAISFIALLTNLLETRMVAYRNACFLKRPLPAGARGIGAWRQMLVLVEIIAVIVNLGFAMFVLAPLKSQDSLKKCLFFLVGEHVALFSQWLLKSKFPPLPRDVENIAEQQQQDVKRTFVDLEHHRVEAEVLVEKVPDVGPRALSSHDLSFNAEDPISE
jgi:hypothetical protein